MNEGQFGKRENEIEKNKKQNFGSLSEIREGAIMTVQ